MKKKKSGGSFSKKKSPFSTRQMKQLQKKVKEEQLKNQKFEQILQPIDYEELEKKLKISTFDSKATKTNDKTPNKKTDSKDDVGKLKDLHNESSKELKNSSGFGVENTLETLFENDEYSKTKTLYNKLSKKKPKVVTNYDDEKRMNTEFFDNGGFVPGADTAAIDELWDNEELMDKMATATFQANTLSDIPAFGKIIDKIEEDDKNNPKVKKKKTNEKKTAKKKTSKNKTSVKK